MFDEFEFEFMMYATAKHYLEESLEGVDINTQPKIVIQALGVARRYLILHKDKMSRKRFMEINDSIDDKEIHEILDRDISFLVFAMELIRLLKPVQLNQRKFDMFTANYTLSMIKLKKEHPKKYYEKKELIDESKETAQKLFNFYKQYIKNEKSRRV